MTISSNEEEGASENVIAYYRPDQGLLDPQIAKLLTKDFAKSVFEFTLREMSEYYDLPKSWVDLRTSLHETLHRLDNIISPEDLECELMGPSHGLRSGVAAASRTLTSEDIDWSHPRNWDRYEDFFTVPGLLIEVATHPWEIKPGDIWFFSQLDDAFEPNDSVTYNDLDSKRLEMNEEDESQQRRLHPDQMHYIPHRETKPTMSHSRRDMEQLNAVERSR